MRHAAWQLQRACPCSWSPSLCPSPPGAATHGKDASRGQSCCLHTLSHSFGPPATHSSQSRAHETSQAIPGTLCRRCVSCIWPLHHCVHRTPRVRRCAPLCVQAGMRAAVRHIRNTQRRGADSDGRRSAPACGPATAAAAQLGHGAWGCGARLRYKQSFQRACPQRSQQLWRGSCRSRGGEQRRRRCIATGGAVAAASRLCCGAARCGCTARGADPWVAWRSAHLTALAGSWGGRQQSQQQQ